ncbi:helix-turn-helix domain-containing protein [Roseivivax sp. CAU 1761]
MSSRTSWAQSKKPDETPRSFDDFELRLGDVMRGERATMGKSLLDVQRELRIKASYIAAIENSDPTAFDTPGFIAGYVRSYARYLGMDPDETYAAFCSESGFAVAHGMSAQASSVKRPKPEPAAKAPVARDPFTQPALPFAPHSDSLLSRIEPGAIGSMLVLVALIGGIGYGGWTVLQEVQRVQVTPVDQTPVVLSDLDPVAEDAQPEDASGEAVETAGAGPFSPPSNEALDRLYRPQALDVPVLVARDAPISTLDPSRVGVFAQARETELPAVQPTGTAAEAVTQQLAGALGSLAPEAALGVGTGGGADGVTLIAVRPAWVRVTGPEGTLYEGIMNAGDTWTPPAGAAQPILQVGESGAIYFAVDGEAYGPAGPRGTVTSGIRLTESELTQRFETADPAADADFQRVAGELGPVSPLVRRVAEAEAVPGQPRVLEQGAGGVTIVATAEAWVRVRDAGGTTLYEAVMRPGDTWQVPQMEQAPTIRTGNAGAIYFAANGQTYGPYGSNGAIADNLALSGVQVAESLQTADPAQNQTLAKVVAELATPAAAPEPAGAADSAQ